MGIYLVMLFSLSQSIFRNELLAVVMFFDMPYSLSLPSAGSSEQDSDTEIKLPFVKSPNPVMALVRENFRYRIHMPFPLSLGSLQLEISDPWIY